MRVESFTATHLNSGDLQQRRREQTVVAGYTESAQASEDEKDNKDAP
jgi:hypothetical protein